MKYSVTRIWTFDAAHQLVGYNGPCGIIHGHTYKLEVTLEATCLKDGMVVDFVNLNKLVKSVVLEKFDHKMLNQVFPETHPCHTTPTAENLLAEIHSLLKPAILVDFGSAIKLGRITLWETPNCYATVEDEVWR